VGSEWWVEQKKENAEGHRLGRSRRWAQSFAEGEREKKKRQRKAKTYDTGGAGVSDSHKIVSRDVNYVKN